MNYTIKYEYLNVMHIYKHCVTAKSSLLLPFCVVGTYR